MGEDKELDELLAAMRGRTRATAPDEKEPAPSRCGPRREETVTYRVRVELADTEPPVWRGLELASDLFLNEVHDIIQTTFAWEDSHLHRFADGPGVFSPEAEHYLMPFEVAEGEPGAPEEQVRLDEVLAQTGDRLFYVYDFGDGWEHELILQGVEPRGSEAPRAVCTAGSRPAPPEDCGGAMGYELVLAATDPEHPEHREALVEYRDTFGQDPEPERAPMPFDIDAVNVALRVVTGQIAEDLPEPIAELVSGARLPLVRVRLVELCTRAMADRTEPPEATVWEAVRAYAWFLDHVGEDGLELTGAGYLRPVSVREAAEVLGADQTWIGKANREVQTLPVLLFRRSAQWVGLVRKYKGRLLLTPAGRRLRGDHRALWDHLAERVPRRTEGGPEWSSGLLLLLLMAAGERDVFEQAAELLTGLGWRVDEGMPVGGGAVMETTENLRAVLDALGGWSDDRIGRWDRVTERGREFARAALIRWP